MAKASVSTKEEVLEAISQMSVMDLVELISEMEEKFGVSAAAPVANYRPWLKRCKRYC